MVPSRLVDALGEAGFAPTDALTRARLIERVTAGHRARVGRDARWRWWVPGRLEVFGKHTDYAGGRSLLAAVPRGLVVAASPRDDFTVRVGDLASPLAVELDARSPGAIDDGWGRYVSAAVRRLSLNFPEALEGVDVTFESDLPRAAGLSSSSALVVGVATALIAASEIDQRPEWQASVQGPLDLAGYLSCVENGQSFRRLAGTTGVGTEGGSEDHTAILAARASVVSQFRFLPTEHIDDAVLPRDWQFVVATSGVHADKAGRVREDFNRASRLVNALRTLWLKNTGRPPGSLAEIVASVPNAPALFEELCAASATTAQQAIDLRTRLAHFMREDARVAEAADAFRKADRPALAELARASQADAEVLLANQTPETVALVESALAAGAFAATSFGAGFGGSAWALVPSADVDAFGDTWVRTYRSRWPETGRVEWCAAPPSPPRLAI